MAFFELAQPDTKPDGSGDPDPKPSGTEPVDDDTMSPPGKPGSPWDDNAARLPATFHRQYADIAGHLVP